MRKIVRVFPLVAVCFATADLSTAGSALDSADSGQSRLHCSGSFGDTLNCSAKSSGNAVSHQGSPSGNATNPRASVGATTSPSTGATTISSASASGTAISSPVSSGGYVDGSANASAGVAQLPNLLTSYNFRPPWKVAGVDYRVGVPAGLALKAPDAPSALPKGASLDASARTINVFANNVTLDGFDLSKGAGYGIDINPGVSGTRITRNLIVTSSPTTPAAVVIEQGASNTYVAYNTIDGGGLNCNWTWGGSITNWGQGLTFEYNWVKNFPGTLLSSSGGSLVYKYNLLENGGWNKTLHLNYLQFGGGQNVNPSVGFNTVLQQETIVGGEGFQMYTQESGGSLSGGQVYNNTMISATTALVNNAASPSISYFIHTGSDGQNPNPATGTVHDNYMDISNAYGALYTGTQGFTYSNNLNMKTGKPF
jgi:hypothetical protein